MTTRTPRVPARTFATFLCQTFAAEEYAARMAESLAGGDDVNTIAPFIDQVAQTLRQDATRNPGANGDITITPEEWVAYRDFNRAERAKAAARFREKHGVDLPTI